MEVNEIKNGFSCSQVSVQVLGVYFFYMSKEVLQ